MELARRQARLLPAALLVLLTAVYLPWGWCDEITDVDGDSSSYMLAARYFSPFQQLPDALVPFVEGSSYPPLFPLVIGIFGGSILAGHLVVVASLLLAAGLLLAWMRQEGFSPALSAWLVAVFALMPGTYLLALHIWTENLYLCLSLLAIVAVGRAERQGDWRFWGLAAAAAGGAILVRTAALPLLASLVLYLAIRRPRHWRRFAAAAALPFLGWLVWSGIRHAGIVNYAGQWSALYATDAGWTLTQRIGQESYLLVVAWLQAWLGEGRAPALCDLVLVAGAVGLAGWAVRLRRVQFDALYVALYGALLLVWPFPAEAPRLSYVIVPALLVQGALLLRDAPLPPGRLPAGMIRLLLPVVLSIVILPSLLLTVRHFIRPLPADMAAMRHTEDWYKDDARESSARPRALVSMLGQLRGVAEIVHGDQCIISIKPSLIMLYTGRPSYGPPPLASSDADFESGMRRCRYAFAMWYNSPTYPEALYPARRLQNRGKPLSILRDDGGRLIATLIELPSP